MTHWRIRTGHCPQDADPSKCFNLTQMQVYIYMILILILFINLVTYIIHIGTDVYEDITLKICYRKRHIYKKLVFPIWRFELKYILFPFIIIFNISVLFELITKIFIMMNKARQVASAAVIS